ncbi:MAG TPA: polysaccharide biosynthesis/export family protein [Chitinophagaceae bacterium]|nr:polysaccharide biosynthesis/export family protein [Chitinophagaceae bacterium]
MPPRVITVGDDLFIGFGGKDNEAANFFNKVSQPLAPTGTVIEQPSSGSKYIVDDKGAISLPILGEVIVTGLTADQLKEKLQKAVVDYIKDPVVDVRFNTFSFSILGEVRSPGLHSLPLQRTTLFEALAVSGDLPHNAKRYNIQLYRDFNGERKIMQIDLRSKNILNNPDLFQVRNNDVIIVKPRPGAIFTENSGPVFSLVSVVLGLATLAITLIK